MFIPVQISSHFEQTLQQIHCATISVHRNIHMRGESGSEEDCLTCVHYYCYHGHHYLIRCGYRDRCRCALWRDREVVMDRNMRMGVCRSNESGVMHYKIPVSSIKSCFDHFKSLMMKFSRIESTTPCPNSTLITEVQQEWWKSLENTHIQAPGLMCLQSKVKSFIISVNINQSVRTYCVG